MQLTLSVSTIEKASDVVRTTAERDANDGMAAIRTPSEGVQTVLGGVIEAGAVAEQAKTVVDTWSPLLKGVERFVEITDTISNVSRLEDGAYGSMTNIPRPDTSLRQGGVDCPLGHTQGMLLDFERVNVF